MQLEEIKEGQTKLNVPEVDQPEDGDVFYNPKMEVDRNISVSLLNAIGSEDMEVCDALAASGARGIRYKGESPVENVTINDANPTAMELIKDNLELNNLETRVQNEDANVLLRKNKFDFVDLDPFGSPISFVDSASCSFMKEGYLALTATDTAALCGTYPMVSHRRYGIRSLKTSFFKELALRILISSTIKTMGRHDKAFIPKLSYARRHYFRVIGKVEKGARRANKLIDRFGHVSYCLNCDWRYIGYIEECPKCGGNAKQIGEIYMGEIHDRDFCQKVWKNYVNVFGEKKGGEILKTLSEELYEPLYYDTHSLAKRVGVGIPKMKKLFSEIRNNGYEVSKTQLCNTGFRTNMNYKDIVELLENLS